MRSFPDREDCGYMAIFQVHCDESGKLHDTKNVAFGVCVFREDEVAGFWRRWNDLLKDANIAYLHMKEAMRLEGEFRGWKDRKTGEAERDELLEALGKLLHERSGLQIFFVMIQRNSCSLIR